jgi:hypothetical protein
MTERWQERRVEDDLLKRELLLRLHAEHSTTPGRSKAATDDFRRQVRRLMIRRPLFAFKYYLLSVDLGLGRFDPIACSRSSDTVRRRVYARVATGRHAASRVIAAAGRRRVGAGLAGLLATAATVALVGTHFVKSGGTTGSAVSVPQSTRVVSPTWWHPPRQVAMPGSPTQRRPRSSQSGHQSATKQVRRQRRRAPRMVLVSNTVPENVRFYG